MVPMQNETVRQWWCSIVESQPEKRRKERQTIAVAGMRRLWLERNARTFDRVRSTIQQLVVTTLAEADLWNLAKSRADRGEE
jgi:hypothetical protein